MLNFLLGVSGTGKTHTVLDSIKQLAKNAQHSVLIVPEQFSSTAETLVYSHMGDELVSFVHVYSFTSFAEMILKKYGGTAVKTLTDAGRVVMVRKAAAELCDQLKTYKNKAGSISFCTMCADVIKELKIAGATPTTLAQVGHTSVESAEKLHDIALIWATNDALLKNTALDAGDRLFIACEKIKEDYLADKHVFIDNFDGFTAPQYRMLERLVLCKNITIALCCDTFDEKQGGFGLFSGVRKTAQRIKTIAQKAGVVVSAPTVLSHDYRHENASKLALVNELLYSFEHDSLDGEDGEKARTNKSDNGDIQFAITLCDDVYSQCKVVASKILQLTQSGAEFSDIAIITRDAELYKLPLKYELGLAGVAYFADSATTPEHTAPASFLKCALNLAVKGLSSENVLRLLKTMLCGYDETEISTLENYAYTWFLSGEDWRAEFCKNPSGFGDATQMSDEEKNILSIAEGVRSTAMPHILRFLNAIKYKSVAPNKGDDLQNINDDPKDNAGETYSSRLCNAQDIARALYGLMQDFKVDLHTQELASQLDNSLVGIGGIERQEVLRSYNTVISLLDEMNELLRGDNVTLRQYEELFLLLLRSSDVGHVPLAQNVVIVTTADRMRLQNPKYCFVLGVSEGEFPMLVGYSGLLTHADRELLVNNGVDMPGSYENRSMSEQMFFYKALTSATNGLFLSAIKPENGGAQLSTELTVLINNLHPQSLDMSTEHMAMTPPAALDLLCAQYRQDTPQTAALISALEQEGTAKDALLSMRNACMQAYFNVEKTSELEKLLGSKLMLSPTRVERYNRCNFSYFMQYVLRINKRKKAQLSPLETGSLVHFILEETLKTAKDDFTTMSEENLRELAHKITDEYVQNNMPQATVRFAYLIGRLKENATQLLFFLQKEQMQSNFHPVAFEQQIGFEKDDVPPLALQTPEGKTVYVVGKIDRVDVMNRENHSYIRVVDYKTGDKKFNLDDVYCGLDIQMLFYLFSVCNSGKNQYKNPIASGVLYVQGDPAVKSDSRQEAKHAKVYKVDGLVLDDELVIRGMDKEASGVFVPFSFGKNGVARRNDKLAGLEKLGNIERHISDVITQMAAGLYRGEIDAMPLCSKGNSPCKYCEYRPVCRHEDGIKEKNASAPKNAFAPVGNDE